MSGQSKNNYPLPLISDIVKNIGTKKIFIILEKLFEPIVMFFGLTNLLVYVSNHNE